MCAEGEEEGGWEGGGREGGLGDGSSEHAGGGGMGVVLSEG